MTNVELWDALRRARRIAAPVGSMHAYWDLIFDIEAILSGEKSSLPRAVIEDMVMKDGRLYP